ncbi:hypothetical protein EDD22DRAFT_850213 [Suillus occidentalis]|nr:hypothetical protein EDD22DRAFT_850213 [Suillus occidentalis]
MNNYINNNVNANGGVGDQNRDRDYQEWMYITWDAAQNCVRQQLYHPDLPFDPYPLPPVWPEETWAMMILWVARERRIFEMEMEELEYLLGLRDLFLKLPCPRCIEC